MKDKNGKIKRVVEKRKVHEYIVSKKEFQDTVIRKKKKRKQQNNIVSEILIALKPMLFTQAQLDIDIDIETYVKEGLKGYTLY